MILKKFLSIRPTFVMRRTFAQNGLYNAFKQYGDKIRYPKNFAYACICPLTAGGIANELLT